MVAIAMGLLWAGYTGSLWGYCLVKGYNITFKDLVSPTAWYSGSWPPPTITDPSIILPGSASTAATPPATNPNQPPGTPPKQNVGKLFPKIRPGG